MWHLFLSSHIFRHVLGHPRDQWEQKGQKFPDLLRMTPRSWKLAQRCNFWLQILYCHSFRTNHKFWPFLEHLRGQNGSKIAYFSKNNPPETANLHRELISHQRFDTVTHFGQIKTFNSFWLFLPIAQ